MDNWPNVIGRTPTSVPGLNFEFIEGDEPPLKYTFRPFTSAGGEAFLDVRDTDEGLIFMAREKDGDGLFHVSIAPHVAGALAQLLMQQFRHRDGNR